MALRSLYVEPEVTERDEQAAPAIVFRDVFHIYRSGPVETVALRGIDLTIERGSFVALLGPSGCGKSTMISLAAGFDTPSAGEIRIFGRSLSRMDDDELATLRAREIALILQNDNLSSLLSARENVVTSLRLAGVSNARNIALDSLEQFGLRSRARSRAKALSGGEQQRVAIAAAAARRADLVLADEPTGELDAANERIVLDALKRLRDERGSTVVAVTHSHAVATAADRVLEMRDGQLVA